MEKDMTKEVLKLFCLNFSWIILDVYRRSNAHVDMLYFCKVYREKEAISSWKLMFTVVKDLDVLSEVLT